MPITTFSGDTGSPLVFTFQGPNRFGVVGPINISGFTSANFVLHLWDGTTQVVLNGGTWLIIDGPNGVAQYTPLASEITNGGATTKQWTIYAQVLINGAPKTMQTDSLFINPVH